MKPLVITVHAPNRVWQPTVYKLTAPDDALRELRRLARWIDEGVTCDQVNTRLLLRLAHWALAMDALLDGLLELIRQEQEHELEAWWCGSWPGTAPPGGPQDEEPSEEVAV